MAPIMSSKLLNEILMQGGDAEVDPKRPLTIPAVPRVRPALTVSAGQTVVTSATIHRMVYSRARYTSLPNSKFIFHAANQSRLANDKAPDANATLAPLQKTPAPTPAPSMGSDSTDGHTTLEEHVASEEQDDKLSAPSSAACSEPVASTVSTASSVRSSISSNQPSTAATSIPPWECMYTVADPVAKFGVPQVTVPRYTRTRPPPADSIRITRKRRASEAERADGIFISRARKNNDARGLKGLGMRTLQVLKKVKW